MRLVLLSAILALVSAQYGGPGLWDKPLLSKEEQLQQMRDANNNKKSKDKMQHPIDRNRDRPLPDPKPPGFRKLPDAHIVSAGFAMSLRMR